MSALPVPARPREQQRSPSPASPSSPSFLGRVGHALISLRSPPLSAASTPSPPPCHQQQQQQTLSVIPAHSVRRRNSTSTNNGSTNNTNSISTSLPNSTTSLSVRPAPMVRSASVHSGLGDGLHNDHQTTPAAAPPASAKSPSTATKRSTMVVSPRLVPTFLRRVFTHHHHDTDADDAPDGRVASVTSSATHAVTSPVPGEGTSPGQSPGTVRRHSDTAPDMTKNAANNILSSPRFAAILARKLSLPESSSGVHVIGCEQCDLLRHVTGADDAFCSERCARIHMDKNRRRRDNTETNIISLVNPEFQKIHSKARWNAIDAITNFINKGCPVDLVDGVGNTSLCVACQNGHYDLVKYLLEQGAKVDHQNISGCYPLHFAIAYGFDEIAQLLLEYGADPTARNYDGQTPVEWRAARKLATSRLPWNARAATERSGSDSTVTSPPPTASLTPTLPVSPPPAPSPIQSPLLAVEESSSSVLTVLGDVSSPMLIPPGRRGSDCSTSDESEISGSSFDDRAGEDGLLMRFEKQQRTTAPMVEDFDPTLADGEISLLVPPLLELPPSALD